MTPHAGPGTGLFKSSGFASPLNGFYPGDAFLLMMAISMSGALFTWLVAFVIHYRFRRQWAASGNRPPGHSACAASPRSRCWAPASPPE